jgi:hypothetical protein
VLVKAILVAEPLQTEDTTGVAVTDGVGLTTTVSATEAVQVLAVPVIV